jgi:hypothetical protein
MIEPVATPSVLCSTADTRDQLIARSMVIATDNDEVAAEQADYRHRRRRGLRCIQVQVGPAELNRLVAEGYLLPGNREDTYAIGLARLATLCSIGSMAHYDVPRHSLSDTGKPPRPTARLEY